MNNLLPSSIKYHWKFDLKGSSYGRKASQAERKKNSPTFKDLDFPTILPEVCCNTMIQKHCHVKQHNDST